MRVLITGSNGQLGRALTRAIVVGEGSLGAVLEAYAGAEVDAVDVGGLDIVNALDVDLWFAEHEPYDVVINCAACTNVDGCETNPELAFAVNANGPENLARACQRTGAVFVHLSTDYVFAGDGSLAYREWDRPAPVSTYGNSKLEGEIRAFSECGRTQVVRTAWMYGDGHNFVRTMLHLGATHEEVVVVDDQLGNPTSADDVACEILRIALSGEYGVWHCTNEGICSWADLAEETFALAGLDCKVRRCTSDEWQRANPSSAVRPHFSALENARLEATIGNRMRPWQDALADYLGDKD